MRGGRVVVETLRNQRGMTLGVMILSAIMFSAAAVAVLSLSMSSAQTSDLQEKRLRAQYAAEAGLVTAMQKLWANPSYPPGCLAGGTGTDTIAVDTDGDGSSDTNVLVTVTNCGTGNNQQLSAKVLY